MGSYQNLNEWDWMAAAARRQNEQGEGRLNDTLVYFLFMTAAEAAEEYARLVRAGVASPHATTQVVGTGAFMMAADAAREILTDYSVWLSDEKGQQDDPESSNYVE